MVRLVGTQQNDRENGASNADNEPRCKTSGVLLLSSVGVLISGVAPSELDVLEAWLLGAGDEGAAGSGETPDGGRRLSFTRLPDFSRLTLVFRVTRGEEELSAVEDSTDEEVSGGEEDTGLAWA